MLLCPPDVWEHRHRLVSNIYHELQFSLTVMSGYLHSKPVTRHDNLSGIQKETLETAASEADRMTQYRIY
ncbi:histidine kinase dimerization/phospho-acceptor domain-containing protein [cyanobacterium endosymbiont of Rhopalodia gibberula]|uniref:histidine kinase dimerization/phospho-acceptor domain-containing protein n=1 Tax=cyanobacterium endosymbiont of Rhopalodia gibberula TaxID=1763363 RepID=UPI000E65BBBA|nr:histidine kinase dimerization/phospho-acceptor domain-containing protein [cyanobacterium endosymbiont of Rhopalodia gibberula]